MAKKLTTSQIINRYEGYLHHFIEDSGYAVIIEPDLAKTIVKDLPQFKINKEGRVHLKPKATFSAELLAAYYQYRYNETRNDYYDLLDKVQEFARNV